MAFKIALGSLAFKARVKKCNPCTALSDERWEVEIPRIFLGSGDRRPSPPGGGQVKGQSIDNGQSKVQTKVAPGDDVRLWQPLSSDP